MYVMSKDGFVLLVMGYTGPEAMRMKKAYIARFNDMEEQLRTTSPLLPNFRDPIAAAEAWAGVEIMVDKPGDICHCAFVPLTRDIQRLSL